MRKIIDTSSLQCKVLVVDGEKYIIRYPRKIGVPREYYRSTPENEIMNILQGHIRVPKLLYKDNEYYIYEYIEGQLLSDKYGDHKKIDNNLIDAIVDEICHLVEIDANVLLKYANWDNNSSFYNFQCKNTEKIFRSYYENLSELYDRLGISFNIFKNLYNKISTIDDNRQLSIIHGDRHKKNAILSKDGKLIFIDWELGCIGDLAYDIAFHLHQMAYIESDEVYFLNKLKNNYQGNYEKLLNDVNLYRLFILTRSMLYHVYWTNLVYKNNDENAKKKQLEHFMRRYNKMCKYKEFNLCSKTEEELNIIFDEYNHKK